MNDWETNLMQDLPVWVVPAAIVHVALFLALIVPTWRAFARARTGGAVSLVLILPGLGLLVVAAMLLFFVLRRAGWSPVWFILVLVPVVNIVFMWLFAFAAWSEREPREPAASPPEKAREPTPSAPPPDNKATPKPAPAAPPPPPEPEAAPEERDKPEDKQAVKEGEANLTLVARAPEEPEEGPARARRTVPGGPHDEDEDLPATEPRKAQPAPKGRAWQLRGANDRAAGLDFTVFEEDLRQADNGLHVGRSARSNIILEDESVSRNHARLVLVDGGLKVEDLDSMNGTWVDGEKAEAGTPIDLGVGVEVEFGKLKLVVTER